MRTLLLVAAAMLVCVGCRTRPVDAAAQDMAAPADLAREACNDLDCLPDELCVHPCSGVVQCQFKVPDGGCPMWFKELADCGDGFGRGCAFDFTPRCVRMDPGCIDNQSCATCNINVCPICKGVTAGTMTCQCF